MTSSTRLMASLLLGRAAGRLVGAVRSIAMEWLAILWLAPLLASTLLLHAAAPLLRAAERVFEALGLADHLWMAIGLALRPFSSGTPGYFERRCVARALNLGPPHYAIEVRRIATASVNDGKDVLRATLWLPKGVVGPFPTLILRSPYGAQDKNAEWGQMMLAERGCAPDPLSPASLGALHRSRARVSLSLSRTHFGCAGTRCSSKTRAAASAPTATLSPSSTRRPTAQRPCAGRELSRGAMGASVSSALRTSALRRGRAWARASRASCRRPYRRLRKRTRQPSAATPRATPVTATPPHRHRHRASVDGSF